MAGVKTTANYLTNLIYFPLPGNIYFSVLSFTAENMKKLQINEKFII
jgi:hypothetical protein